MGECQLTTSCAVMGQNITKCLTRAKVFHPKNLIVSPWNQSVFTLLTDLIGYFYTIVLAASNLKLIAQIDCNYWPSAQSHLSAILIFSPPLASLPVDSSLLWRTETHPWVGMVTPTLHLWITKRLLAICQAAILTSRDSKAPLQTDIPICAAVPRW